MANSVMVRPKSGSGQKQFQAFLKSPAASIVLPIFGILSFLLVWQLCSAIGLISLPGPIQVLTDERSQYLILNPLYYNSELDQGLLRHTLISLGRVTKGYLAAAVVGIAVGILVGSNRILNKLYDPLFQFLRMVAPLAWVPISLAALRQNEPAALFVIFITAIWPIMINTAVGVREIPQDYKNVARVLEMSRMTYFTKVLLPSALPYIFTGLRIAIGLAWLAIIAAEIVMSGVAGIGFFIWDAYQQNYVTEIIVAVVYIGAVGLVLDRLMDMLQNRIVSGQ